MKDLRTIIAMLLLGVSLSAFAGQDRGGVDPRKIDSDAIQMLIESGDLKKAILNYLRTLPFEQIADDELRALFTNLMLSDALQNDVATKGNYEVAKHCLNSLGSEVPASTVIGAVRGKVCFNTELLAGRYQNLSVEDTLVRLGAVALHEHIHHFQSSNTSLEENERVAHKAAAYVQATSTVSNGLLKWYKRDNSSEPIISEISCAGNIGFIDGSGNISNGAKAFGFTLSTTQESLTVERQIRFAGIDTTVALNGQTVLILLTTWDTAKLLDQTEFELPVGDNTKNYVVTALPDGGGMKLKVDCK